MIRDHPVCEQFVPLINDRFYMNPVYGRAVEAARAAEDASQHGGPNQQDEGDHWVTIDGRHVLILDTQAELKYHRHERPSRFPRRARLAFMPIHLTGGRLQTGKLSARAGTRRLYCRAVAGRLCLSVLVSNSHMRANKW
jgi:hypothetical protein